MSHTTCNHTKKSNTGTGISSHGALPLFSALPHVDCSCLYMVLLVLLVLLFKLVSEVLLGKSMIPVCVQCMRARGPHIKKESPTIPV